MSSIFVQWDLDKYQIEQVFRFLKADIDVHPFYHRKPNQVTVYFFISYLIYVFKSIIEYKFKKIALKIVV